MSKRATPQPAGAINPGTLYSLPEFRRVSGLGDTTFRTARQQGLDLPAIRVGRRKYVEGTAGIKFIKQLGELYS